MKKIVFLFLSLLLVLNIQNTQAKVNWKINHFLSNWYCYTFNIENTENNVLSNWEIEFFIPQYPNVYQTWNWNYGVISDYKYKITANDSSKNIWIWEKIEAWFCATNVSIQPTNIKLSFTTPQSGTTIINENNTNNSSSKNTSITTNSSYYLEYFRTQKNQITFKSNSLNNFQSKLDKYIEIHLTNKKNYKWITYYRNKVIQELKSFEDKKISDKKLKVRLKMYFYNIKLLLK